VTRRTLRLTVAAAVAALALPLAACQTHQGTAAYIGDTRITTNEVDEQVDNFYSDPFWAEQGKGQRSAVHNRTVNAMIISVLLEKTARAAGIDVPTSAIDKTEKDFKAQPQQIPQGLQGSPPRVAAEVSVYASALQTKFVKGATSQDEVNQRFEKALADARREHPITVNPRYGTFDPKTLGLVQTKVSGVRDVQPAAPAGEEPQPDQQQN